MSAEPLLRALAQSAAADSEIPVVAVAGQPLTASELVGAAAAVARRVREQPVVAVQATPTLETVVAILGCLAAGVPAVPVPADAGRAELAHLLTDSGARLWLGDPVPGVDLQAVPVDPAEQIEAVFPEPDPADPALVLYTSGTTGAPKGVVLSRRAIAADLDGLAAAWEWTPHDVLVHGLPLFHVHGLVLGVLGPLRIGGRLIHTGRPTPAAYAEAARSGGTLFFGVPTVWSRIAADPPSARALSRARLLISGSAALPAPVARALADLTGQVPIERYGMTETLITIAAPPDEPRRIGWVGQPVEGVQARIVDDSGAHVAADGHTLGDLQIRGATLFEGYLGRSEETSASFTADGWFRTGDVAVVDDRGWYRLLGRRSADLIKSGGYRIGAVEIESSLLAHPAVAEAAVVGLPDDDLGQRIVAFVVRRPDQIVDTTQTVDTTPETGPGDPVNADALTKELIAHVAADLSVHKRPREVRFVDSLPRNEMGKVQKARLA